MVTLTYRMASETPPIVPMKLKVEINSREHFAVMGVQKKKFSMASPWFTGECEVPTFDLNELLATKLRALYQRGRARSVRPMAWPDRGQGDGQEIVGMFRKYMEFGGHKVSQTEFAANWRRNAASEFHG